MISLLLLSRGAAVVTPRGAALLSPHASRRALMSEQPPPSEDATSPPQPSPPPPPQPAQPKQFDVRKLQGDRNAGSGAGFNQFDPILTLSGVISRRFGIAGGLAVVALLAATEGNEILKSLNDKGPVAGSGARESGW